MTYEEAVKYIDSNHCGKCCACDITPQNNCPYKLAIESIEKQIPKKSNDYYEDSLDDECAVCGTIVFERDRYCPRCGQAIDWSE